MEGSKEVLIAGTRVENIEGEENALLGYTSRGVSIVLPDHLVRVVLFGFWLDELQTVSFSASDNCSATSLVFEQVDFISQTDKRVVVTTRFPEIPNSNLNKNPSSSILFCFVDPRDRNNVMSLLFVKDLPLLDADDNFTIQTVCGYHQNHLRFVMEDTPLRVMLEEIKKGDCHLAMVQRIVSAEDSDPTYELVGVVGLEDIVGEIPHAEIVDETDAVMDHVNRTRGHGAQARNVSCLMDSDEPSLVISVQMQLVGMQCLTTSQKAFHSDRISQSVLEKLIKLHCHRVELSHVSDMYGPKAVVPRTAKLYTKQKYSKKLY
ncbi:hypothetical protein KIN20_028313 [Parelaphostrongylus tenuis]|uniref:Uncharacterized protein n=1 Tax=Parelaphostrongylus tenuis TaxID=148309 RepID=A0AAD5R0M1_PARTN|nr:hypothetical protein KIN20_028313 [Parelaphostrongylus tenuis]